MTPKRPASDSMPGLRVRHQSQWGSVQQHLQAGGTLIPLLPLGDDAAIIWVPKNGCSTIKRVWLQLQGFHDEQLLNQPHSSALPHTYWLTQEELKAVAQRRAVMAIWRDPIERFVSACKSHLQELTQSRIDQKLWISNQEDLNSYQRSKQLHHELFLQKGCNIFSDDSNPINAMNSVALRLPQWISCHIDWSHHTIPQVSFLGGDPSCYHSLHGMENINSLTRHWQTVSGMEIDATSQHVSSDLKHENPWRHLKRDDLTPEALKALQQFYAADWAFLELAQTVLGTAESDQQAA